MLGTTALQIFNETVSVPWAVMKWTQFYEHESCGKCTPCREGTYWLAKILERMVAGDGTPEDIDTMRKVVSACPVPILVLGGSRTASDEGVVDTVRTIMQSGAAGVFFGRNIFQSDAPSAMIQAVGKVVHEFLKPEQAFDLYRTLKNEQADVVAK